MGNVLGGLSKVNVVVDDDDRKGNIFMVERPFYTFVTAFFLDVVEKAAIWLMYGTQKIESYYMLGNYGPVDEFGPEPVLTVKGDLPECLNGDFVRVGPNPRWKPSAKYHWFDGDGMLHGLRIKDGNVTYVSRYVRTSRYAQEEYWGGPKFRKIGDMVGKKGLLALAIFKLRLVLGVIDESNGGGTGERS